MAYLMCMDAPVYSTRIKQVLRADLMPCPAERLNDWRKSRLFLRGVNRLPEEDERRLGADSITVKRRLSLSDSYWFKYNKDPVDKFYQITPYTNEFTEYGVCLSDKSSPSLTVTGSVNKVWRRINGTTVLHKVMLPIQVEAEAAAVSLAQKLKLPVNDITVISNTEIYVYNFTEPGIMLMRLQPWDLQVKSQAKVPTDFGYNITAVGDVYKNLGITGNFHIKTILFDAVVSNYDRLTNLSNWGYFKSGITGVNTYAPLYDFNLAHPEQRNMYIHIIKKQITDKHKTLLRKWRPAVKSHGFPMWLENLDELLNS